MTDISKEPSQTYEFAMRKQVICLVAIGVVIFIIFIMSIIKGSRAPDADAKQALCCEEHDKSNGMMAEASTFMLMVQENPQNINALRGLAATFSQGQDWKKATIFWTQVINLAPDDVNALYHRGMALVQAARFHDAIADFEKILTINPNEYHALYYMGIVTKHSLNENDRARKYFQRALDMKPQEQGFIEAVQNEMATL
jgi:tetratricopeptide (TPR) repeat protein